ncbi:MAG: hypothetical protein IPJ04_03415 [Candidatus Eisenbacteria bacterium]|nr:hypothetical protein [Candidatus Eisenbacteria bacterium]
MHRSIKPGLGILRDSDDVPCVDRSGAKSDGRRIEGQALAEHFGKQPTETGELPAVLGKHDFQFGTARRELARARHIGGHVDRDPIRLGEFDLDQMRRHRAAVGRVEIDLGIAGLFLSSPSTASTAVEFAC